MRIRVKICCMASPDEARMAAAAGADLVGLVGPMPSGAGIITPDACRRIADAAPSWVTPVLLTSSDTAEEIEQEVRNAGVRAVQLVRHVHPSVHDELARRLPGVRRIQVIHVEDDGALGLLVAYSRRVEAFLLDSGSPSRHELGGTGRVHNWGISSAFTQASPIPVFLAGGLTPMNVGDAIRHVRPFGIDVCSGLRTDGKLDQSKLAAFMARNRQGKPGGRMTILNIGSINIDHAYRVTRHPAPGETVLDKGYLRGLGGKGANMSFAASAAGADVRHAGAIGADGAWCRDRLAAAGVDVSDILVGEVETGHGPDHGRRRRRERHRRPFRRQPGADARGDRSGHRQGCAGRLAALAERDQPRRPCRPRRARCRAPHRLCGRALRIRKPRSGCWHWRISSPSTRSRLPSSLPPPAGRSRHWACPRSS